MKMHIAQFKGITLIMVTAAMVGCGEDSGSGVSQPLTLATPARAAAQTITANTSSVVPLIATATDPLDQGWNTQQKNIWYEMSQGSRMLPMSWVKALEQPDSPAPFLADDFWEKLGFPMYDLQTQNSPLRLPRGFTVDQQDDSLLTATHLRWKQWQSSNEPWFSPTCAACHTSQIDYKGTTLAVPGGQTLADWQTMLDKMNQSLDNTYNDAGKFDRFAKNVLASDDNTRNRTLLKDSLKKLYDSDHLYTTEPSLTTLQYGPGRLDAIGHIFKKVSQYAGAKKNILTGMKDPTLYASDAPTSFPFVWNVPQLDRVQWTGFAPNAKVAGVDIGAIIRNTGEVAGVFADVQTHPAGLLYISSVQIPNLVTIEETLAKLKPPAWPVQTLGVIDPRLAAQGQKLYQDNCASCHTPLDRTNLTTPIKTTLTRVNSAGLGTDPWSACNLYQQSSASGNFALMPQVPGYTVNGTLGLFGNEGYVLDMTAWMQIGIILNKAPDTIAAAAKSILLGSWTNIYGEFPFDVVITALQGLLGKQTPVKAYSTDKQIRKAECLAANTVMVSYKARPLNGIWASAPYLHNGSVPTLYDLLLPPEKRPKTFYTGSHEFDPVKVGYVTAANDQNHFLMDTQIEGNSNAGHDYGNSKMTDQDIWALVEYMKTQ